MLNQMRGAAKSWAAKVLLGLLVLSFGVWGIADVFTFRTGNALAMVGDQQITTEQFAQGYQNWLQNYQRQTGGTITPDQARQLGLDRLYLNDMIRNAALDAEAGRLKLAVSDDQLVDAIQANPTFHNAQGQFDPGLFRQILDQNGLSEASYLASERQRFLRSALLDTAANDFNPPDTLTEAAYRHRNEQRDARYFVLRPTEQHIPQAGEQDLKNFWEENGAKYTAPEYRSIAVIKAEPQDVASAVQVTDDEIAAAYEKYKRDYFKPETRAVLQIPFASVDEAKKAKERIAAGADFLAVAKERGLTEADASLGEIVKTGIFDELIADAAFSLPEGAVSDPVQGKLSVVLLKVTKVAPEKQSTLAEVKNELKSRLQLEKAREEIQNIYNTVEDARAEQLSFEDIAKRANLKLVVTAPADARGLDKDGKAVDIPLKDEVLKQAFQSDVGVENDALTTPSDGYLWYEVRDVTPAAVKPFESVKSQVEIDWKARKLREVALEKARQMVERARNGTTLEALAAEAKAEIKTVQGLKRNETTADFGPEAVSALFSEPETGFAFAPEGDGKGAKIMQSQAVLLPQFDPASEEAKTIDKALSQGAGNNLFGGYIATVQSQHGTTVDEDLWRQVTGANAN